MHEQIARVLYYLSVHLLFASVVWLAAWILTAIVRGSNTTKYWIWVATSVNFIVPAGALVDRLLARHLTWASPLAVIGGLGARIAESSAITTTVAALWTIGAVLMLTRLRRLLRTERRDVSEAPAFFTGGVPVIFAGAAHAPAVDGLLRARIVLPNGIDRLLSRQELAAVLIHELAHARRRDNLIRLVYELARCVLWFHPLVWLTASRLSLYRELSCDEAVIHNAHGPDLIQALAKLADPGQPILLQAMASSHLSLRLARLVLPESRPAGTASAFLAAAFGAVLAAGVLETVAHTACCFVAKH